MIHLSELDMFHGTCSARGAHACSRQRTGTWFQGCLRARRFINGMKAQNTPLKEAKVVFYGAGSSAVGVAEMIARLIELDAKVSPETARKVRC